MGVRAALDLAPQHAGHGHVGAEIGPADDLVDAVRTDRTGADDLQTLTIVRHEMHSMTELFRLPLSRDAGEGNFTPPRRGPAARRQRPRAISAATSADRASGSRWRRRLRSPRPPSAARSAPRR